MSIGIPVSYRSIMSSASAISVILVVSPARVLSGSEDLARGDTVDHSMIAN